jgi:DNA-binding CsgD family transcriptional regulator
MVECSGAQAATAVERWFHEAMLGGDTSAATKIFSASVVMHSAAGDLVGPEAMAGAARELCALSGRHGEIQVVGDGDHLLVTFVVRGRHTGVFCGTEPTGRVVEIRATVTIRVADGKLAELWKTCVVRHCADDVDAPPAAERQWARRWRLTARETLVAELAMLGHADKEIAAQLELATASVSKYLRAILRKAGVATRTTLAERAGRLRLG